MRNFFRWFRKGHKGFTLVEILVVIALMAVALSIAVPNLNGVTTRAEKDKYYSYCLEGRKTMDSFCILLNLGETKYDITDAKYHTSTVNIATSGGLTTALNDVNRQAKFRYFVLNDADGAYFTAGLAGSDPKNNTSLKAQDFGVEKDVLIPVVIAKTNSDTGVTTYELRGFWYYSTTKNQVLLTYNCIKSATANGYKTLKDNSKW